MADCVTCRPASPLTGSQDGSGHRWYQCQKSTNKESAGMSSREADENTVRHLHLHTWIPLRICEFPAEHTIKQFYRGWAVIWGPGELSGLRQLTPERYDQCVHQRGPGRVDLFHTTCVIACRVVRAHFYTVVLLTGCLQSYVLTYVFTYFVMTFYTQLTLYL